MKMWKTRVEIPAELPTDLAELQPETGIFKGIKEMTNGGIAAHHRDWEGWLNINEMCAAFDYVLRDYGVLETRGFWEVASQEFEEYLEFYFEPENAGYEVFNYNNLSRIISGDRLEENLVIRALNTTWPRFVDLDALARDVRFMIIRMSLIYS